MPQVIFAFFCSSSVPKEVQVVSLLAVEVMKFWRETIRAWVAQIYTRELRLEGQDVASFRGTAAPMYQQRPGTPLIAKLTTEITHEGFAVLTG